MLKAILNRFGHSRHPSVPSEPWALSTPLLTFGDGDDLTLGRAIEGVLILGATGSGKSSASGRTLALSLLDAGVGALVLCVKPDERQVWEQYCRETNRLADMVIFGPKNGLRFNPIDHEYNRAGDGAGQVEELVKLIEVMQNSAESVQNNSASGENGRFFQDANRQLSRNAIKAVAWATGHPTIRALHRFVSSMPRTAADLKSKEWADHSFCVQCLEAAGRRPKTEMEEREYQDLADFIFDEWVQIPDKTQKSIAATFTTAADVLRHGVMSALFDGESNIDPMALEAGKVIIVDVPVLEYGKTGKMAQVLWKYCTQRSLMRRNVKKSPRPVVLWQDEAQLTLTEEDFAAQSVLRGFRGMTVMLSQNVSNFYAVLGGEAAGKAKADSLFGNLNLKIFHCNSDSVGNNWASELIGRSSRFMFSANQNYGGDDAFSLLTGTGGSQGSAGVSEQIQFEVEPRVFTQLRTGGVHNDLLVDAIIFAGGVTFKATGKSWRPVTFSQK